MTMPQIWWLVTAILVVASVISTLYTWIFEKIEDYKMEKRVEANPWDETQGEAAPIHIKRIPLYSAGIWILMTTAMLFIWLFFGNIVIGPVKVSEILQVSGLFYVYSLVVTIIVPLFFLVIILGIVNWLINLGVGKF